MPNPPIDQPPLRPLLRYPPGMDAALKRAHLRVHMDGVKAWEAALIVWEAAQPRQARLIFRAGPDSQWIRVVTPSLTVPTGWRCTSFSTRDHMPMGHDEYSSRLLALREALFGGAERLPDIPFQVEPLSNKGIDLCALYNQPRVIIS